MRAMIERLDMMERGLLPQDMTFMPPRHGKTETRTVRWPAYRIEKDPTRRFIIASYSQTSVERMSRKIRRLCRRRGVKISEERDTAAEWETTDGGGVRAVGVGGGVAGHGGDGLIWDDPIRSREQAESIIYRDKLWEWYTDDFFTRREPGAVMLGTVTRWHYDDLPARILASEDGPNWSVLSLPAIAEEGDPIGRQPGEALCPDRFPIETLEKIRGTIGPYGFEALYQQRPTPRTGNMFPRAKVSIVPVAPAHVSIRWARGWDKAGTKDGGKRTAGTKLGVGTDHRVYIADDVGGQLAALEREQLIRTTAYLDGPTCLIVVEQEPGSGGKDSAQSTVQTLAGFPVRLRQATTDKFLRAEPFAAQWQAGNVVLVGPIGTAWHKAYLDEMELAGPGAAFLDRMDASAMAYNELTLGGAAFTPVRVKHS
jgi:predicted phage terminase large subunit-like protein